MSGSILIAGVGNVFFGDDAFGCEVTRRLSASLLPLPDGVAVRDFGVSMRALGYALAARSSDNAAGAMTVIVDAVAMGAEAGTLHLFDLASAEQRAAPLVAHHAHGLQDALDTALALGGRLDRTYLLGCEPVALEPELCSPSLLSAQVEAAVCRCVGLLLRVIDAPDRDLLHVCASTLTQRGEA